MVSNDGCSKDSGLTALNLDFIARALKPFPRGINQALTRLNLPKEAVIMVGDQIMTDIKAAHSAGVRSVLVKPVIATDSWKTQFNRLLERRIMKYLLAKNPEMKWQGELK